MEGEECALPEGEMREGTDLEGDEAEETSRPVSQALPEPTPSPEPAINPVLAQILQDDKERFELGVEEVSW